MGQVSVTRLTQMQKEVFAKQQIQVLEEISEQDFKEVVCQYLDEHNVLHLATCSDNQPRSTALEYTNHGLEVYIFSEGGGKIKNLKNNPQVSYTISDPYHPLEDYFSAQGLQVWGRASMFRKNDDPERFAAIWKHSAYAKDPDALKRQGLGNAAGAVNFHIITIVPQKVRYVCARKGYRGVTWTLEPDGTNHGSF